MPFGPLMISIQGKQLTLEEAHLLQNKKIGGIILFQENFESKKQVCTLISTIRAINPQMLIAIDQEGGKVQRFNNHEFTKLPAAKDFGDLYNQEPQKALEQAEHYGFTMAKELLACGINLSFAPVLDKHTDTSEIIGKYHRAFHTDLKTIAILTKKFADGMHKAGMPVTGKHFPEHGICSADSHKVMPIDNRSQTEILEGLYAYQHLIANNKLDIIMPAHVCYPNIEENTPGGFSRKLLKNILRDQLKFQGTIISDCLSMGALKGTLDERVNYALKAGQDMVIVSHQTPNTIDNILGKIQDNSLQSKERLKTLFEKSKVKNNPQDTDNTFSGNACPTHTNKTKEQSKKNETICHTINTNSTVLNATKTKPK